MTIKAILAHDDKNGIGKNGSMPWPHNKEDMKWFRDQTRWGIVVMGRKTWESIGSVSLKDRYNIVISSSPEFIKGNPDEIFSGDLMTYLHEKERQAPHRKIWVIGGANIYEQCIPFCDNLYLSHIKGDYDCDTFVNLEKYTQRFVKISEKNIGNTTFSVWI